MYKRINLIYILIILVIAFGLYAVSLAIFEYVEDINANEFCISKGAVEGFLSYDIECKFVNEDYSYYTEYYHRSALDDN